LNSDTHSVIELSEIQEVLPHRYPFLLIDRIVEVVSGQRIVALKNVTANEPFFQGHFPGFPVMPGVLIVEALAQAGCVLALKDLKDRANKIPFFAGIDSCRFRKPVVPGDQLRLELSVLRQRGISTKMDGKAYVGTDLVAEAEILAVLGDRDNG
jgi:beta-hydroxyacyl-ACP dehydratase FabZ